MTDPVRDVPLGNVYDKYGTKNPVARLLMAGFFRSVQGLFDRVGADAVLEVGCGEGRLADRLIRRARRRPRRFVATDLSLEKSAPDLDPLIELRQASAYELPFDRGEFDLCVCCEVLEHLEQPRRALEELARVTRGAVLLSTPREPLWRMLNMARGKYWRDLGNTPGHIQHFSRQALIALVSATLDVRDVRSPVPWTVVLAETRQAR